MISITVLFHYKLINIFISCSNNLKCVENKCDQESQICEEPEDPKDDGICKCRSGFVNMTTTGVLNCEKYNPCNEDHRNHMGKGKACKDSIAKCMVYGDDEDDYMCACPKGFKTTGGIFLIFMNA